MRKDYYRSQFRFSYDLYEKLKAAAERNHRSLNAEVAARLDESFAEMADPSDAMEAALNRKKMTDMARAILDEMGIKPPK